MAQSERQLWRRRGLLIAPPGRAEWASHAQLPTVLPMEPRLWRIFFAARTDGNQSMVRAVDVDPLDGMRVIRIHPEPVLALGEPGAFDSAGVAPACAVAIDGRVLLYYTGMRLGPEVPYQMAIGLAVSDDGLTFRRHSLSPILPSAETVSPYASTPHVRWSGAGFEMWFVNGRGWRRDGAVLEPIYDLHRTWSNDGVVWEPTSELALGLADASVEGLTRPWIIAHEGGERLWFSSRGLQFRQAGVDAYRLHTATLTPDGRIEPEGSGPVAWRTPETAGEWDSWMQSYACVVPYQDGLAMFYCGDHFGKGGFGWASLEL